MAEVREKGLEAARHLEGELWEVRVDGDRVIYRTIFAQEGARSQILLALEGLNKKTQKTPRASIDLAKRRLADWLAPRRRHARGSRKTPATLRACTLSQERDTKDGWPFHDPKRHS